MNTPHVVALPGSEAFSEFRRQALSLQAEIEDVRGQYIHYVDLLQALDENASNLLNRLLADKSPNLSLDQFEGKTYYVLPRPGTTSPWSSKATNIAQVCGLRSYVRRIERGIKIVVCSWLK